jgi:hypothetical protein
VNRSKFAVLIACAALLALPSAARADFGFVPGTVRATATSDSFGHVDRQAGSHPYAFTVALEVNNDQNGKPEGGPMRDLRITLPPGLVGNPQALPTCPLEKFVGTAPRCPADSQIGFLHAQIESAPGEAYGPIFNLEPPPGVAAAFGFSSTSFTSVEYASLADDGSYRLSVLAPFIPVSLTKISATFWGTPAEKGHEAERYCFKAGLQRAGCATEGEEAAYLTLPSNCGTAPEVTVETDSTENPGVFVKQSVPLEESGSAATMLECGLVPFSPVVAAAPTSAAAESASGLDFNLSLPNQGLTTPGGVAETEPVKTEVVLPQGVAINPSAANGIVGCTSGQYASASLDSQGCPEASKVGTLVAKTPLIDERIEGSVYLAQPHDNKFGSLLALYIVAKAKERGVLVKQAGLVQADPQTGQLTTTFDELPPLPYSAFEFDLREGPRAPLITPQACGEYQATAKLYPFSDGDTATVRTAPFKITSGANGGSCADGEGQLPSHPSFEAGTATPLAGSYSPLIFRVARTDGEQRFSSIQATLPAGLLGRIAGVPYCPESGLATAGSRTGEGGGAQENASPSCPSASQVGTVSVAAGAGSQPYNVQGKVYLAGPYKGAPLSLEIITPVIAGPFDLGSVAVRTALYVDETTAQIRAVSDSLPSILHGIPLDVRTISLNMDKPQFTLNPTDCSAKAVTGAVQMLTGSSAALSSHFAVAGCTGLAFEPSLKLSFSGQTKRLGNPAIKAVLTQPKGQNANVSGATVILPKGMFIDQAHINNPCTRVQFNSGRLPGENCPANSILGTAKVWTPLLEAPEEGKVYFRSNGGERELPDLAVALRGQIPLQLLGFVDSVGRKGAQVRRVRSRFLNLPDAPVSRFELKLSGGKKGLLENSKNLCKGKDLAKFQLTGQNGKTHNTEPKIQVQCGKKSKGGKKVKGSKR